MEQPQNHLDQMMHCPACNSTYDKTKAFLVDEEENQTTFHFTCKKCNVSSLVFVSLSPMGVVSFGVMTDLEKDEVKRLFKKESISEKEILEAYQFFKDYKGTVSEIINLG